MNLSPSQENQFLQSCEELIWSVVHKFKARNGKANAANMEDLFQEASIVMLEHVRRSPDEATARKAPILDMTNAMCRYLMAMNVVHIPQRTTDFSKSISYAVDTGLARDGLSSYARGEEAMEDVEANADFDIFLGSLSRPEKIFVQHKLMGRTNRDAGRAAGIGDAQATRMLRRLRKKYAAFAA